MTSAISDINGNEIDVCSLIADLVDLKKASDKLLESYEFKPFTLLSMQTFNDSSSICNLTTGFVTLSLRIESDGFMRIEITENKRKGGSENA